MNKDFRDLLVRRKDQSQMFHHIKMGRFTLSIQASEYHYSQPRLGDLSPKDYECWEVALFFNGKWVNFRKWKFYYWGPWMEFHEGMDVGVFAYMPTHIVQKLYKHIKLLSKLTPPKFFSRM